MRALLRLFCLAYPREFRRNYCAQILDDFNERHRAERNGLLYCLQLIADIVTTGIAMRAEFALRDLGTALRRLRKTPLLALVIVVTFALGIGANVAAFSVLNAVVLRPLPYPNAPRVLSIGLTNTQTTSGSLAMSVPDVADLASRSMTLANVTGFMDDGRTVTGLGKPRTLNVSDVTYAFFDVLGIEPEAGRFFAKSDAREADPKLVIISDAFWRSAFHADLRAIGRFVTLDGTPYRVAGVAPRGFETPEPEFGGLFPAQVWLLIGDNVPPAMRGARDLSALAGMKPGYSPTAAKADMDRVLAMLREKYKPLYARWAWSAKPLREALLGRLSSSAIWEVYAAALGVFLIMCANVAGLLLTQANVRRHELSLRVALGASRSRVASQLLTESGLLAAAGALIGLTIAYGALHLFTALASAQLPRLSEAGIDLPVLGYAVAVTVAATLLAGTAPAWIFPNASSAVLGTGIRNAGTGAKRSIQSGLVVAEIAVALALVACSGLAIRSFYALTHANLGIRTSNLLATDIFALPDRRFPTAGAKREALDSLNGRLLLLPGARTALASSYPTSDATISISLRIANRTFAPEDSPIAELVAVSPSYFDVLGIALQRGRVFGKQDSASAEPVAIVSTSFARYLRNGENAVGTRIQVRIPNQPGPPAWRTVVGEVADDRDGPQAQPQPTVYVPLDQAPMPWITALVETTDYSSASSGIANAFQSVDSIAQPPQISTIEQRLGESASAARLSAALLTALALIALCLAVAGVFAIVSSSVSQRFQEFGIRMAIGSTAAAVVGSVLTGAMLLIAAGVAIGLILAALAGRAMMSQLYAVQPADPLVLVSVTLILAGSALLSAVLPALRAARIDPAKALRYE